MKKLISLVLALLVVVSFSSCIPDTDDYISGEQFDIPEYKTDTFAKFENKNYGIIIEYPESFQRLGNFDLDGYISFEEDDVSVKVYIPDTDTDTIMSVEEYCEKFMKFPKTEDSKNIKHGKSTGYESTIRNNGRVTVEFIVKGVDGFYRFSCSCLEENYPENKERFEEVFASIRVDDGIYNKLNRMAARYKELLDYAASMQYVTDANYANHCLNNYEISKDSRNKDEAAATYRNMKDQLVLIVNYEADNLEEYEEYWTRILEEAKKMVAVCDEALVAIESGNIEEAQRLTRGSVTYDLAEISSKFISVINAEIAEY